MATLAPKPLLEQIGQPEEVEITATKDALLIQTPRKPRAGWANAFKEMAKRQEDFLVDGEIPDLTAP